METIGFIGVGMMGGAITTRLCKTGVPVLAYDTNLEALRALQKEGVAIANSVSDVVDRVEIVFACLPNPSVCRSVALGSEGVAKGKKVKIYVETSTYGYALGRELTEDLAKCGIAFLDCPVVGGTVALETDTLGVLASGDKRAFERVKHTLESFAGQVFYLGEQAGLGQAGKVVNNSVAYAAFLSTCEAVALGMKAGLSIETVLDVINQGSGANFFSQRIFPNFIMQGKFEGTGAIEIGLKDVKLFLQEAERLQMEVPMASAVSVLQKRILDSGPPGRDILTMFHFFSDLGNLPR